MGAGTVVVGVLLLLFGLALSATIIGAIIGVPLIIVAIVVIVMGAKSKPVQPVVYVQPQPFYYPPPAYQQPAQAPVVIQNYQAAAAPAAPPPPQVMFRCRYCQSVYPETAGKCPKCGAGF